MADRGGPENTARLNLEHGHVTIAPRTVIVIRGLRSALIMNMKIRGWG
jgi:hypothetical protein